jgi:hypothetical protein
MCILYVKLYFVLYLQYFEKVFVCGFVILCLCCFCFVLSAFLCMLCIFMNYSTSYCCHYKLKDPWNVCVYICVCVGVCVCYVYVRVLCVSLYVRARARVCVYVHNIILSR